MIVIYIYIKDHSIVFESLRPTKKQFFNIKIAFFIVAHNVLKYYFNIVLANHIIIFFFFFFKKTLGERDTYTGIVIFIDFCTLERREWYLITPAEI